MQKFTLAIPHTIKRLKHFAAFVLGTGVSFSAVAQTAWVDGLSIVALQELRNGDKPNLAVMSVTKSRDYTLPAHERVLKSRRQFPKDEFGTKDYFNVYSSFYRQEKERVSKAKTYLLPANVDLGSYNFEIGAFVPKIAILNVRGEGDHVCGTYDVKGGTNVLTCLRLMNLAERANPFATLRMDEETARLIRRSKIGFTLNVVPIEEKFSPLDVDVRSVGRVGSVLKAQAAELIIYDQDTQNVLYSRKVNEPEASKPRKPSEGSTPQQLPPIETKVELSLPGSDKLKR